MTELAVALVSLLSVSVAVPVTPVELVDHLQWVHVWLPSLGLLGMGLRGMFGGDDDDDDDESADDDPLGYGFGGSPDGGGGGLDDGFEDGLGDEEEAFDEVGPRIDDLETELDDLASTVSAVHGDHEELKDSLDEIEDNVRKLLEVYEVVTQSMNPFADEAPAFAGGANASGGPSAFGLLDGDEEDLEGELDAAAEDEPVGADELFGDLDEEAEAEALLEEAADEDEGLSFDDLKSEFDFVGDGSETEGDAAGNEGAADSDLDFDGDAGSTPAVEGSEKPYLRALPDGFGAELLVMEWLDYLVAESSVQGALRAVRYYGTVGWISEEVATHLQTVLTGMSPPQELAATDGGQPAELSVDHHTESLEYISQLRAIAGEGSPLGESPGHRVGTPRHDEEDYGVQR